MKYLLPPLSQCWKAVHIYHTDEIVGGNYSSYLQGRGGWCIKQPATVSRVATPLCHYMAPIGDVFCNLCRGWWVSPLASQDSFCQKSHLTSLLAESTVQQNSVLGHKEEVCNIVKLFSFQRYLGLWTSCWLIALWCLGHVQQKKTELFFKWWAKKQILSNNFSLFVWPLHATGNLN